MLGRSTPFETLVDSITENTYLNVFFFFVIVLDDDFVSECDLFIACTILQKQIEHIDGKKENIVIPSFRMKHFREQNGMHIS
jgi:hypothetical protein